jgi:hypothetical protein
VQRTSLIYIILSFIIVAVATAAHSKDGNYESFSWF